jgi:hypothetical protein
VVEIAAPFIRTCAPATNFVPVTRSEKLPVFAEAGLIPVIVGVGFSKVTPLEPLAVVSAALVAFTITVFGAGRFAGAVYFPFESIVPTVADPPFAPFTDQDTPVLFVPVTPA